MFYSLLISKCTEKPKLKVINHVSLTKGKRENGINAYTILKNVNKIDEEQNLIMLVPNPYFYLI